MTSSTIDYLIERYFNEYECDNDNDIIHENIHAMLDDYVSCNHYKINIEIIDEEVGSVYDAIKLYEDTFGEFGKTKDMSRPQFYSILAYVCLEYTLIEKINEKLKDIDDVTNDTDDATNES